MGVFLAFVLLGAGCATQTAINVQLAPGDSIAIRKTVFGIGGKLTELIGVDQDERSIVVPEAWPDATSAYNNDTFVLLPKSVYAELIGTGSSHISLGLFDETVSEALSWVDRLNSLAAMVGAEVGTGGTGEDVLLVTVTDADATDWVRLNGELRLVKTIEASNRFASYKILANSETPIILSLTLTPAARAEFSVLSSFEGFEVSEIASSADLPSADPPRP